MMAIAEATTIRLAKIVAGELILCEPTRFVDGYTAVETTLRRAAISGRVEIGPTGDLGDWFADLLNDEGDLVECVALDRKSYRALKTKWAKTRIADQEPR